MEKFYRAFDGKEFDNEEDCAYYENTKRMDKVADKKIKVFTGGKRIMNFSDMDTVLRDASEYHFADCETLKLWNDIGEDYGYEVPDYEKCDYDKPLNFIWRENDYGFRQISSIIEELEDEIAELRELEKKMEEN